MSECMGILAISAKVHNIEIMEASLSQQEPSMATDSSAIDKFVNFCNENWDNDKFCIKSRM